MLVNSFPNKHWFLCVGSTSLLKTLWEKEKLLVTSNFSFSHSVFYPFGEFSAILIKLEIVVFKLFQFGRVQNLSFGKGLRKGKQYVNVIGFVIHKTVKTNKYLCLKFLLSGKIVNMPVLSIPVSAWISNLCKLCYLVPRPIAQSVVLWTWEEEVAGSIPGLANILSDILSLTAVHCYDSGYAGKQPVAWKEYCAEYRLKELKESMDRCTCHHDITEILLKMALNSMQSINPLFCRPYMCLNQDHTRTRQKRKK